MRSPLNSLDPDGGRVRMHSLKDGLYPVTSPKYLIKVRRGKNCGKKVLIVEDDRTLFYVLKHSPAKEGQNVSTAVYGVGDFHS